MSKYKTYPKYKDSGVEWLGEIPEKWDVKKIKYTAVCAPSNIDKKSKNGEETVILCNYTDVYYNEEIDSNLDFMWATATDEQIKKFALKKNDVIITKDSEDPNDIAVPTLIIEDVKSLVCGYHLALIRATNSYGPFLKRYFDSKFARSFFATKANGLTRYGLGTYPLINAPVPMPPFSEQQAIAAFLDYETGKIDKLIEKQEELIVLLEEKRQAVISHAVTKGLNPTVPMKDSGVEWLGEIPEHWGVGALGYYAKLNTGATPSRAKSSYWHGEIPWIKTGEVKYNIIYDSEEKISINGVKNSSVQLSPPGTLLMAMYGQGVTRGRVAILGIHATYNQACVAIQPNSNILSRFLLYFFMAAYHALRDGGNETSQMNLNADIVSKFKITVPKIKEQIDIIELLDMQLIYFDKIISKAKSAIELMRERRTALISAAVTGKIDVRDFEAGQ